MKCKAIIWILAILMTSSFATAERIDIGNSETPGNDLSVMVLESNHLRTVVRFDIGAFAKEAVEIDGSIFYTLRLEGAADEMTAGHPGLPIINRSIMIPEGVRVHLNVVSSEYVDIPNIPVAPSKGPILISVNPVDVPYSFGHIYDSAGWYPPDLAALGVPFHVRELRGVTIHLNPFRYNPASKTLRVYNSITVQITSEEVEVIPLGRPSDRARPMPEFTRIYKDLFLNYRPETLTALGRPAVIDTDANTELLAIVHDDFADAIGEFVEWKTQKGIKTTVFELSDLSVSTDTAMDIKSAIQDFYDDENHNLAYVLLVGDESEIPPFYFYHVQQTDPDTWSPSDFCYSLMADDTGYVDSNHSDIIVGRFSAETSDHVLTQVRRTIDYEKTPQGQGWFRKGSGLAKVGEGDKPHIETIREKLLVSGAQAGFYSTYDEIDEFYLYSGMFPTVLGNQFAEVINNEGRSIVNYAGHGTFDHWQSIIVYSSHFSDNQDQLPFIFSVTCLVGDFVGRECFAEGILRKQDENDNPLGAMAVYMSAIEQYNNAFSAHLNFCDALIDEDPNNSFGGLCYFGADRMIEEEGMDVGLLQAKGWVVFGDPSLQVRTDNPAEIYAGHLGEVDYSDPFYEVAVKSANSADTVISDARCALYHDGILYGSAFTNADGVATISFNQVISTGGPLILTITKFNTTTVQDEVQVHYPGIFVNTIMLPEATKSCLENPNDPPGYHDTCWVYSDEPFAGGDVNLWYEVDGSQQHIPMDTTDSSNEYSASIPLQTAGKNVSYWVHAVNGNGDEDTTEVFQFYVIDYALVFQLHDRRFKSEYCGVPVDYLLSITNDGALDDTYEFVGISELGWPLELLNMEGQQITTTQLLAPGEAESLWVEVTVGSQIEGMQDEITVYATSTNKPEVSSSEICYSESRGELLQIPFVEIFPDDTLHLTRWEYNYGIDISNAASVSVPFSVHFYMNQGLGGDPSELRITSNCIDLSSYGTEDLYVSYYYARGGPGDPPNENDSLIVEYIDENGEWHELSHHVGGLGSSPFYKNSVLIPGLPAYRHRLFKIRLRARSLHDDGDPEFDERDNWFVDDITVSMMTPENPPALASPPDGTEDDDATPDLYWHAQSAAFYYKVIIDDEQNFDIPYYDSAVVTDTCWGVSLSLSDGQYYWRVESTADSLNWTDASVTWKYKKMPPEVECPTLYVQTDRGYEIENNVLSASEDTAQNAGFFTDYYVLELEPKASDGGYIHMQFREDDKQVTLFDEIRLTVGLVDEGKEVGVSNQGTIFCPVSVKTPLEVYDVLGVDIVSQLSDKDGTSFVSNGPGELVVNFGNVFSLGKPVAAQGDTGGPGFPPPEKNMAKISPYAESSVGNILRIDIKDAVGGWQPVGIVPPRKLPGMSYFQLSDYANEDQDLWMRLRWDRAYKIDHLAYYRFDTEGITLEGVPLNEVIHSVAGDVRAALTNVGDHTTAELHPGETISFTFDPVPKAPPGKVARYVLTCTGRYETKESIAASDPFTSESNSLEQNSPNPFNEGTIISYSLAQDGSIKLEVFDILGRRVTTLIDRFQAAGRHSIRWDGRDRHGKPVASGIYFYRLTTEEFAESRKMILIK